MRGNFLPLPPERDALLNAISTGDKVQSIKKKSLLMDDKDVRKKYNTEYYAQRKAIVEAFITKKAREVFKEGGKEDDGIRT